MVMLSLVEHSLGVRGVGSSNLPVPTIKIIDLRKRLASVFHFVGDFVGTSMQFRALSPPLALLH